MKKRLPIFLAGVLTSALVFALTFSALAATGAIGTVEFNTVVLTQNGEAVFYAEEDYLLSNGCSVPSSILFTDPSGNGTTYLPVRRIATLFSTEIGWDSATGSVTIGAESPAAAPPSRPQPTTEVTHEPQAEPLGAPVYVTNTGGEYHRSGCRYLKSSQNAIPYDQARNQGYSPCSVCKPG